MEGPLERDDESSLDPLPESTPKTGEGDGAGVDASLLPPVAPVQSQQAEAAAAPPVPVFTPFPISLDEPTDAPSVEELPPVVRLADLVKKELPFDKATRELAPLQRVGYRLAL